MIAAQNVQESNLAWSLIEVAKPQLKILERNYVFITTGAGDTFAAIHHLLKLIAAKRIPVRPDLIQLCRTWLEAYAFHEEEPYLRDLIECYLFPDVIRAWTEALGRRYLCQPRVDHALLISSRRDRHATLIGRRLCGRRALNRGSELVHAPGDPLRGVRRVRT